MFILRPDALSHNGSVMIINQSINQSVLDLGNNSINDHVMISFGDLLSNKCRLWNLGVGIDYDTKSSRNLWLSVHYHPWRLFGFYPHICNSSSILSNDHSNLLLEKLLQGSLSMDLRSLLRINREKSNSQAARIKIIKTHFSGSDINTHIFAHMEVNVLPPAIAWMGLGGGSNGNSDIMFAFLRSMPPLCDAKSKSKKRKWQVQFRGMIFFAPLWTWPYCLSSVNFHLIALASLLEMLFCKRNQSQC